MFISYSYYVSGLLLVSSSKCRTIFKRHFFFQVFSILQHQSNLLQVIMEDDYTRREIKHFFLMRKCWLAFQCWDRVLNFPVCASLAFLIRASYPNVLCFCLCVFSSQEFTHSQLFNLSTHIWFYRPGSRQSNRSIVCQTCASYVVKQIVSCRIGRKGLIWNGNEWDFI